MVQISLLSLCLLLLSLSCKKEVATEQKSIGPTLLGAWESIIPLSNYGTETIYFYPDKSFERKLTSVIFTQPTTGIGIWDSVKNGHPEFDIYYQFPEAISWWDAPEQFAIIELTESVLVLQDEWRKTFEYKRIE